MSFSVWFRNWIRAFCRLLTFDYTKRKSEAQRKRERERRLKAKHSSANLYRIKKKRKKRRSGTAVQNEKLMTALFGFVGASLAILFLPFGLLDWGRKSAKARKASRGNGAARKAASKHTAKTAASQPKEAPTKTVQKEPTAQQPRSTVKATLTHTGAKPTASAKTAQICLSAPPEPQATPLVAEMPPVTEPDENTPKSTPKNERDRYIRKRMIIAGSYYCDKAVLDALAVGSYVDLEAEPDNAYDKDAVKLLFNGQKIGYIAKEDHMTFVASLRLKRKIYGVITAIIEENGKTKYEYEAWFDSTKPN